MKKSLSILLVAVLLLVSAGTQARKTKKCYECAYSPIGTYCWEVPCGS